jgi:anti-anti-sigma regulatory factor
MARRGTGKSMWKLRRVPDGKYVVLKLSGRINADELSELSKAFSSESNTETLVLDLSEVDIAGEEAVKFLAACETSGVRLRNCPDYIREWIRREKNGCHPHI